VCIYGYEMYTAIMNYAGKVTVHVISAMSAATLLVCAADEALISDTGIFMIHNTQSYAEGDYRDLQMEADALREFNAGIINAYVRKTGKSREEIQSLMDNSSYMSPQTAIEHGFIDGYMFGDPNAKREGQEIVSTNIVAADIQLIPEDKAKNLIQLLVNAGQKEVSTVIQEGQPETILENQNEQKSSMAADSDKEKEGGKKSMTLNEFLTENPEAVAEVDAVRAAAKAEGKKEERDRMQSLDAIAGTVAAEMLYDAKYGENPLDGPALAYKAMVTGEKAAAAYMTAAKMDSEESGVGDVGVGTPDAGQEQTDESDEMAAYINRTKGGM
ncbi:MAG: Clp protease ClpP, partial [Lachnospiraceae bacterium]|nr:Clp protease ClpP [Lachnospiraceae bacterium]